MLVPVLLRHEQSVEEHSRCSGKGTSIPRFELLRVFWVSHVAELLEERRFDDDCFRE